MYSLSTANDHILTPPHNPHIPFIIHNRHITRPHPRKLRLIRMLLQGLLCPYFVFPVTLHDDVAACAQLAWLTDW